MISFTEKILTYIIGGIGGAVVGYWLNSLNLPLLAEHGMPAAVTIVCIAFGTLLSIAWVEHNLEKTLKRNSDIRNETVALITHEMRTGLTSTGWAIEMVLKKYGQHINAEDTEMLKGVVASIKTTVMHSVNLLDVSLLDVGKLSISLEKTDLDKVELMFRETLEKYKLGAERKNVTLTSTVQLDHARQVEVDMMRLRIVLENLLENALQYTQNDPKKIDVRVENKNNDMLITISDNGIGIPDSEKEKIFTEFYRASNARLKLSSGSGIGLYTCAQYITAHRGKIRFESEEGKGTTFYISIPLKTVADVNEFLSKI